MEGEQRAIWFAPNRGRYPPPRIADLRQPCHHPCVTRLTTEDFLGLFASWVGSKRVDAIGNELQTSRRGGFQLPETGLIVLFAARAGSNYLGQLLSSTGWFREIGESCRPSQLIKIRDRHRLADCHSAAQWMIDNRGTPAAFGMKAGALVLIAAAQLGLLPELVGRSRFLHLRRRDRVAQAVSMYKARLGGRTHTLQPEARMFTDDDYDALGIAAEIQRIDVAEAQFASLLDLVGQPASTLYYEDILEAPEASVAQVCNELGLTMPEPYVPSIRLGILRDDLSARWRDRFKQECPGIR